jgi:hypothetical protein
MKRIIVLSLALVLLLAIAGSGTFGSFDDTELSTDNQLIMQWEVTIPGFFYVTNDGTTDNGGEDKLFVYDATGTLISDLSFLLAGTNSTPSGAATANGDIYVLDQLEQRVYRYPSGGGTPQISKYLKKDGTSALSNARGLAISGNELLVTRYAVNTPILYCYSLTDAFAGPGDITPLTSIPPPIEGNKHPTGLAIDDNYLYVLDGNDMMVYAYPRGTMTTPLVSKVLKEIDGDPLLDPTGAMCDGSSLWVVDRGTDKVYEYSLYSLFMESESIEAPVDVETIESVIYIPSVLAAWEFPLVAENDNATGM